MDDIYKAIKQINGDIEKLDKQLIQTDNIDLKNNILKKKIFY